MLAQPLSSGSPSGTGRRNRLRVRYKLRMPARFFGGANRRSACSG